MATIIDLNDQLMPRSDAHQKMDRAKEGMRIRLKARWGTLYALGFLGGCLLIVGEALFGPTVWRGVWDLATAGATLVAMGRWVRANRLARAMEGRTDLAAETPQETAGVPVRSRAIPTLHKRAA